MITVTINDVRGGHASAPFFARSIESLSFRGMEIPAATSVALLTIEGETLALAQTEGNNATLNLNTLQADAATAYLDADKMIPAVLAVGDADTLLAVVRVQLGRSRLATIAPPTESAPVYPSSAELRAILAEMTAQADRAEDAVGATEKAQQAVADYIDVTFPAKVEEAERTIEKAVADGTSAVTQTANQAIGALDTKQAQIEAALDGKLASANTAIDDKVEQANQAKTDAVEAKDKAESAKGQAEGFAKDAGASAESASNSAQQAEDAKTAIGDADARLNALETGVEARAPKILQPIKYRFDYNVLETKTPSTDFYVYCHDGWVCYNRYSPYQRFHISSTGLKTEILRRSSSNTKDRLCTIIDVPNATTRFYEIQSGTYYRTTISGTGDNISITREPIDALPTEAMSAYANVIGLALANGYIVCNKGQILDSGLNEVGTFNCSATVYPMTQLVRTADNTVCFFDTATNKLSKITVGDDGTPTIEANFYAQTAQTADLYYLMASSGEWDALRVNRGAVARNNNSNGIFYPQTASPLTFYGATRNLFVFSGRDLYQTASSHNHVSSAFVQVTFGLVNTFGRPLDLAVLREDGAGNFAIFETPTTVYQESTGFVHVFKKK